MTYSKVNEKNPQQPMPVNRKTTGSCLDGSTLSMGKVLPEDKLFSENGNARMDSLGVGHGGPSVDISNNKGYCHCLSELDSKTVAGGSLCCAQLKKSSCN